MNLYELEQKLHLARQQGAEDNAQVRLDLHTEATIYPDELGIPGGHLLPTITAPITLDDPIHDCCLERGTRHEIVLR